MSRAIRAVALPLILGACDMPELGRGELPCEKIHCDRDRARFWGMIPKSADEDFDYQIEICVDESCVSESGHATRREQHAGQNLVLFGGCKVTPSWSECRDDSSWYLEFYRGLGAPDAGLPQSYRVKVIDTAADRILLDERLVPEYVMVKPTRCDTNPEQVVCTHVDATWDAH